MQPRIVLLDRATLGDVSLERIEALGALVCYDRTVPEEVIDRIAEAEIIITNKVVISRNEMAAAPGLRLICIAATGMNNVDLEAAGELGIVGLGTIGRRVAQVAEAFGMEVVYYATSGKPHDDHFRAVSLEELLTTSDVISIHAPLNERTRNLIDSKALEIVKPTAVLLNAGRGGIVDETALAEALHKKSLLGAGLDVFEREPLSADSPLLSEEIAERLSFTPHTAWASIEARRRLIEGIAANIERGY